MEQKKSVGIWIRVSTEDQARGESPEHHEKRARYYAESRGWDVHTVYHLEAVSGKSVMGHSQTKQMLRDIKDGSISGIIFSKLARLARNTRELLDFADLFNASKADLISLQEAIDTSTPAGRLFYTMIAAMAQWEREEIASRVAASVPIRAKLGKQLGGPAVFGYVWDKETGRFMVNEKEAPIRKLVYEIFLKHKRKKTTAAELNKMGYRTRNGSKFSDTTIDRLIRDPTAKGEHRANYTKSTGDKKQWTLKPESEWVITPCTPIVDADLWNECNRILDVQYKKRDKLGPKAVHLLTGYVFCSCGKRMYIRHTNYRYTCLPCNRRILGSDLEEIYHDQLKEFLLTETDIDSYLDQSSKTVSSKEELLKGLNEEMAKLKKRMDDLVRMRLDGEFTKEAFMTHHKPLEERAAQILDELPELEAEIDFLKIQGLSSDTVLRDAKDLYLRWPTMPYEEKRTVVEAITDSITIGKEDISFKLAYLPGPSQMGEISNASSRVHTRH